MGSTPRGVDAPHATHPLPLAQLAHTLEPRGGARGGEQVAVGPGQHRVVVGVGGGYEAVVEEEGVVREVAVCVCVCVCVRREWWVGESGVVGSGEGDE